MTRPEKILFAKYKFTRIRQEGKLVGGVCLDCGTMLVNCTESRLQKHFQSCSSNSESEAEFDAESQETPTTKRRTRMPKTPLGKRMKVLESSSPSLKTFFDTCTDVQSDQIKNKLVCFAIRNNIDFNCFQSKSFNDFLKSIRPTFANMFGGSAELTAIIPEIYKEVQESSKELLKGSCTLQLTVNKDENSVLIVAEQKVYVAVMDCPDGIITKQILDNCVSI